jgi:hypothetical protein
MYKQLAMLMALMFIFGWLCSGVYQALAAELGRYELKQNTGERTGLFLASQELDSPMDRIPESDIHVYKDRVMIDIENAQWSTFTDTNSMDPVLDYGANAIQIAPNSPEEVHVGDIVSYESDYSDGVIIHRVIEKGTDENGAYFILKGDNNARADPGKIRFSQIRRVVVAIIY